MQQVAAHGVMLYGLSTMKDWILVPSLTFCSIMLVSCLTTNNDVAWWRVVSSFVRALVHCVSLAVTLPGA